MSCWSRRSLPWRAPALWPAGGRGDEPGCLPAHGPHLWPGQGRPRLAALPCHGLPPPRDGRCRGTSRPGAPRSGRGLLRCRVARAHPRPDPRLTPAALCSWRHWRDSSPVIRLVLAPSLWHEGRTDFVRQVGMAQHFLLSAAARSLSAAKVMRMSDGGVVNVFLRLRWPETDGKPVCPGCGGMICYACPRSPNRPRWRCKACRGDFSITSGTLFAHHKLPLRTSLLAVVAFCNEVTGHSMLALSRELDVQYKTAFVRPHKMRVAMACGSKALRIGRAGREVEVDGAYFGGHVRPENLAADRV